jgi:hypothetical protein
MAVRALLGLLLLRPLAKVLTSIASDRQAVQTFLAHQRERS